ncbi:MAG: hypothetical protein A3E19_02675 [Planctomycetes bacterium RIFCSPHIGHO2_12_FULL_52_36]|nr:MAG: hypothetical protein A3D89_02585 [Planctomycetes bacterium RIFCSPHIGHO2_02_FULL_52_58]OHB93597.1 MAG: hypothetical protein A3E19_02675 [Planctomycetes bacterium RIFCSPHIGHO2_12_FULL_52_36]
MHCVVEVKPLTGFKIWLKFSDGVEGAVDLSDIAGKGVFEAWKEPGVFDSVFIDPVSHTIAWPGGIDLCPDSLYAEVTGKDIFARG